MTGYPQSFYEQASYDSHWEEIIAGTLNSFDIKRTEKVPFPLPGEIPKYTADFVLSITHKGRHIILEPHYPVNERFANKLCEFKRFYGQKYHIIVLVRKDDIEIYKANNLLNNQMCDDIRPFQLHPSLIYDINQGKYEPSANLS